MTRIRPSLLRSSRPTGTSRCSEGIDHPRTAVRVAIRADDARRLVQYVVDQLRPLQNDSVDADLLTRWINAKTHLRDDLPVHFDSAVPNQFLAFATAADPGGSENLLQSLGLRHGLGWSSRNLLRFRTDTHRGETRR